MNSCSPISNICSQEGVFANCKLSTKVVLVAISLLFAAGGIAAYSTHLGLPYVIAFSSASVGCMGLFIIACVCSAKKEKALGVRESRSSLEDEQLTPTQFKEMTDNRLKEFIVKNLDEALEVLPTNPPPYKMKIRLELIEYIKELFVENAPHGPKAVAVALNPFIEHAKNKPNKLDVLLWLIIRESGYYFSFIADVFNEIEDSSDSIKDSLSRCFALFIAFNCMPQSPQWTRVGEAGFYLYRIELDTKKIFGGRNFKLDPWSLPDTLAKGIGTALKKVCAECYEALQKSVPSKQIDPRGLQLDIRQPATGCRFPASLIAPILPYLANIPGLVILNLVDTDSDVGHGFKDEHANDLRAILESNSYLIDFLVNVDGMSDPIKQDFINQKTTLQNERMAKQHPPKHPYLLKASQ